MVLNVIFENKHDQVAENQELMKKNNYNQISKHFPFGKI